MALSFLFFSFFTLDWTGLDVGAAIGETVGAGVNHSVILVGPFLKGQFLL